MNNDNTEKRLDELLARQPKRRYDIEAWMKEDWTEEFDSLTPAPSPTGEGRKKAASPAWLRWTAAAAVLVAFILLPWLYISSTDTVKEELARAGKTEMLTMQKATPDTIAAQPEVATQLAMSEEPRPQQPAKKKHLTAQSASHRHKTEPSLSEASPSEASASEPSLSEPSLSEPLPSEPSSPEPSAAELGLRASPSEIIVTYCNDETMRTYVVETSMRTPSVNEFRARGQRLAQKIEEIQMAYAHP